MKYQYIQPPEDGEAITANTDYSLNVPDKPIIAYIEGDGIGQDVTPVMHKVVDAAVKKAYGGKRAIAWMELFAGQKAVDKYGEGEHLPEETMQALQDYVCRSRARLPRQWVPAFGR